MPRLGLGLGAQISASSAYDADAASYFARAGVTDATAKRQISDFVEGLKSLGLYNSMVCWPLRSTQNAGTGTTAYSLGGLGTYNGTLTNGPTWGTKGVSFVEASSHYINIPTFTASPASYLIGAVFNPSTTGQGNSNIIAHNGTTNADAFQINDAVSNSLEGGHRQVAGSTYITPTSQTFTTGVFQFAQQGWTGSVVRRVLNKSSEQTANSAAFGGFISPLRINSRGDVVLVGKNKVVAFAYMLHSQGASLTTTNSIYDLYNSTIGADLYDSDAENYFTTAGITDTTAKRQISDFVVGVKELGLWSSMVCWPLRSSQNAGTGTTVYSLGGWGTFNGTFAGSPTWVANGLSFTTSDSISSDINSISDDFTLVFCASGTGTQTSFSQYFGIQGRTGTAGNQAEIQTPTTVQINLQMRNSGSAGFTTDSIDNPFYLSNPSPFAIISSSIKTSTSLMNIRNLNNATSATGTYVTGTATLNRMQLNGRWTGSAVQLQAPMTSSFCAIFAPSVDASLTSFYTLYKNTLGQGLGLP